MTNNNEANWHVYYKALAELDNEAILMSYRGVNACDEISQRMVNKPLVLINWIKKTNKYNWILLPVSQEEGGEYQMMQVVHGCICQEAEGSESKQQFILGYKDFKFTSDLLKFDPDEATTAINLTICNSNCHIPSLKAMFHCNNPLEFKKLAGNKDDEHITSDKLEFSNAFVLHGDLYTGLKLESTIHSHELAFSIISLVSKDYCANNNKDDTTSGPWQKVKQILVYLWIISQGFGVNVNLQNGTLNEDNKIDMTNHLIRAIQISKKSITREKKEEEYDENDGYDQSFKRMKYM